MALEATHIRFAVDVMSRYRITDEKQYISGSVYPDSRNVSGIDRVLTHHDDMLTAQFASTDFKKGWQVHVLCDILQNKVKREVFSEIAFAKEHNEKDWVIFTAIKIIQDIDDMQQFDLQVRLPALDYAVNPNGEEMGKIIRYNQAVKEMYAGKATCTIDDYYPLFKLFRIDKVLTDKVIEQAKEFYNNEDSLNRIKSIYRLMMKEYSNV